MRLIVTEKNNSAKKIAEILASGAGTKPTEGKNYAVPHYSWEGPGGERQVTIGLKGHVMNPAFPEQYKNWRDPAPVALIDAPLVKDPTNKNVVKAIRKQAKDAASVVIATDFDREGELIGLEALEQLLEVNPELEPTVRRARYSALTKDEITRAFDNLTDLSMPLAKAGEARQEIDLIWGATLTRYVSLATGQLGRSFLSLGRVQSPTLALIVDRELERRAHVPVPYWEVYAEFAHPDGAFTAHHATDKFDAGAKAEAAVEATRSPGVVASLEARKNTRQPPAPFNTTAFTTTASSALGITPSRAMRLAEDLYMDGCISYPRTDNTVYPQSLPLAELVRSLTGLPEFKAAAHLAGAELSPTRGKKETTDHPPIYPTQAVNPAGMEEARRKVYELVVRRFLATFCEPSVSESTRANIEAGAEAYFVRGNVLVKPGFVAIYPYGRKTDEELPRLEQGQELALTEKGAWLEAKETKPPGRYGQGKLIEMMEERGLGTKATRHDILQKLADRGYVHGNPVEPTETGIAMVEAFEKYAEHIATPDMTAELESDMDAIAESERSKDDVVTHSRRLLHQVHGELEENKDDLAKTIWEGMNRDRILGPCHTCVESGRVNDDGEPNRLRIIRSKKSGKRFVGCEGYPDCDQTYGIPQRGELLRLEEVCSVCGKAPRVKVIGSGFQGRGRPWNLCLNDDCPSMAEMKARRAEREAAAAAKEAGEKAEAGKEPVAANGAKRGNGRKAGARAEGGGNGAAAKPKAKPKAKTS